MRVAERSRHPCGRTPQQPAAARGAARGSRGAIAWHEARVITQRISLLHHGSPALPSLAAAAWFRLFRHEAERTSTAATHPKNSHGKGGAAYNGSIKFNSADRSHDDALGRAHRGG